ncbi:MAG: hypothetical protein AAFX39_04060 [Pseudomonadota bacterium]
MVPAVLRSVAAIVCGIPVLSHSSYAEEFGDFSGSFLVELYEEYIYTPDGDPDEVNIIYLEGELDASFYLSNSLFIDTTIEFELIDQPDTGLVNIFPVPGQGAFIEVLSLNYEEDDFGLFVGKFNPNIFVGFSRTPDLYDTLINEDDLEITGQWGGGGYLNFNSDTYGSHRIYGNVFFEDTTDLSGSIITDRGRTSRSDGGPANTGSPESFSIGSLGGGFDFAPDLDYHVGVVRQAVDIAGGGTDVAPADEYRVTAALQNQFSLGDNLTLTPFVEYYHFWNADGNEGETRDYITGALNLGVDSWNFGAAYTGRFVSGNTSVNGDEQLFQVSAGYTFSSGWSLSLYLIRLEEVGSSQNGAVAILSREFTF